LKIITPEGEEVSIGAIIATIDTAATSSAAPAPVKLAPAPVAVAIPAPAAVKPDFSAPAAPVERVTPSEVSDGRTTRKKMSMLRRKIATHLVNAQQTAAILTTFNEVDMTAVMDLRKQVQENFMKKHSVKLGFMSFFVKAVTQALKDVPSVNGRIDGTDIIENHFYDIGVAIGTEKGLIVPVLRDADQKSFAQIEKDILDYAKKAKDGKITLDDLTGGVFTISNGGTYGSLLSTPILNPPQSGILGMHTIQQRPVALNGQVVIRPMMYLALSYDHRLVDGKEAVTFLIRIKDCLENPTRLLLEM
jgi:2-oxoglutarate dehydrogenase E2 component (dihydrolipoamide succinyltransferase)